jgi:hypothetical protein
MSAFRGQPGFYFPTDMNEESVNKALAKAISDREANPRKAVLEYSWDNAVSSLLGKKEL